MPSFTTPPTATSTPLTSAYLNTYVRDNTSFLYSPPRCVVGLNAAIGITTATLTNVGWNQVITDPYSMFSGSGTTSAHMTIPVSGTYALSTMIIWDINPNGQRRVDIVLFPAETAIGTDVRLDATSTGGNSFAVTNHALVVQSLAAGTQIACAVTQSSGVTLNVNSAGGRSQFACWWIGG